MCSICVTILGVPVFSVPTGCSVLVAPMLCFYLYLMCDTCKFFIEVLLVEFGRWLVNFVFWAIDLVRKL